MKALIEIDEKTLKTLHEFVVINTGRSSGKTIIYKCLKAISNGTPIPDNATNDDFFKAVLDEKGYRAIHDRFIGTKWLFEPYKGGK